MPSRERSAGEGSSAGTGRSAAEDEALHRRFELRAAAAPEASCVVTFDRRLDYRQVDRLANRVASRLRRSGVGPETVVGVLLDRSPELIVALLGVLKAGGAFLALDPSLPRERLRWLIEDSGLAVLLSTDGGHGALDVPDLRRLSFALDEAGLDAPPPGPVAPERLAYLIYTSGSTGRPKAVLASHGAMANRLRWMERSFPFGPAEVGACRTPVSFVDFVTETLGPLGAGAAVAPLPGDVVADPRRLVAALARVEATRIVLVPSQLRVLIATYGDLGDHLPRLRLWVSSGEPLTPDLARSFAAALPGARLVNLYGSSEMAGDATCHEVRGGEAVIPLGRPITGLRAHLADAHLHPVPEGLEGDLLVAGAGLARGYLGRPAKTAEAFLPDPFGTAPGERLYRTGDRAVHDVRGELRFRGRRDQQVKVRGVRVEPGEIETALRRDPRVAEAAVVAVGRPGMPPDRLVAHVEARAAEPLPEAVAGELLGALRRELPEPLVPASLHLWSALPRTATGKLDRHALGRGEPRQREAAPVPPSDPLEAWICRVWGELLGLDAVGPESDFLSLGGHSLTAAETVARAGAELGRELSVRDLLEHPTPARLARHLASLPRRTAEAIPRAAESGPAPLSFAQQRLWFLSQLDASRGAYALISAWRLRGRLSVPALAAAAAAVEARHEVLRATFPAPTGEPVQEARPVASPAALAVVDLSGLDPSRREGELSRMARRLLERPFDVERGPLLRRGLWRLGAREHGFAWVLHHMVADDRSLRLLAEELARAYEAAAAGRPPEEEEPAPTYADFARWQRRRGESEEAAATLESWRRRFDGAPAALALPTDRPRPDSATRAGGHHLFLVPAERVAELAAVGRASGATLFVVLLTSFAALLSRLGAGDDLVLGTPVAHRDRPELRRMIGLLVHTLALRLDLAGGPGFGAAVTRVRREVLAALDHQEVPFEKLVEGLPGHRGLAHNPLFQVLVALEEPGAEPPWPEGIEGREVEVRGTTSIFDLSLTLRRRRDGALAGDLEYARALFDGTTVARLGRAFQRLLAAAVANPELPLADLPLLSREERHQVLEEWSGTPAGEPAPEAVHLSVARNARLRPDAVAVVAARRHLSYGELDRRAARLARRLRSLGAGLETPVAVDLPRGPGALVALLAVLRAGGYYVPLDRAAPPARKARVLADLGAVVVLDEDVLQDPAPAAARPNPRGEGAAPPPPEALAYAIHTSGTSGRPRGVGVCHRALARHVDQAIARYAWGPDDRVLQLSSLAFDASLEQILPPLVAGATVVLRGDEIWAPEELARRAWAHRLTGINLPTALFRHLVDEGEVDTGSFASLRLMIVGGEALSPAAAAGWWRRLGGPAPLLNAYGPTEATITATLHAVAADEAPRRGGWVPIGRCLPGRRARVLDPEGRPLPAAVPGELCLAGDSLARCVLGDPVRTAGRFAPDPWSPRPGARLYRTGDRVRWLADGTLEYLGRLDRQVQVRGFRVELGEIEAALARHPAVRQAVVVPAPAAAAAPPPATLAAALAGLPAETAERLLREAEAAGTTLTRRRAGFDLSLGLRDPGFLPAPRAAQRNWLLQRALDELADDLDHLHGLSSRLVAGRARTPIAAGWSGAEVEADDRRLTIAGQQVMQSWQRPLMEALARIVAASGGDVLEIGFGMGISADLIQRAGVRSHTVVECNETVLERLEAWRRSWPGRDIRPVAGRWQETVGGLGRFDGILFDTFPASEEEYLAHVIEDVTFAEHFFATAAEHLAPGGVFTYYTNEIDSFSRRHQRLLLRHFSSLTLEVVRPLAPPEDNENWWADSMVAVRAVR